MTVTVYRPEHCADWSAQRWSALVGQSVLAVSPATALEKPLFGALRHHEGVVLGVRAGPARVELMTDTGPVVPVFSDTVLAACDQPPHRPHTVPDQAGDPTGAAACYAHMTATLDEITGGVARFGSMLDDPLAPHEPRDAFPTGNRTPLLARRAITLWELVEAESLRAPLNMQTSDDPIDVRLPRDTSTTEFVAWARTFGATHVERHSTHTVLPSRRQGHHELEAWGVLGSRAWPLRIALPIDDLLNNILEQHATGPRHQRLELNVLDRKAQVQDFARAPTPRAQR